MFTGEEVLQLIQSLIWLLAGVGVFIVGMGFMSDALEKSAGNGMKKLLGKISNNRFSGVGIGAGGYGDYTKLIGNQRYGNRVGKRRGYDLDASRTHHYGRKHWYDHYGRVGGAEKRLFRYGNVPLGVCRGYDGFLQAGKGENCRQPLQRLGFDFRRLEHYEQ